jgi:hypothetical protein
VYSELSRVVISAKRNDSGELGLFGEDDERRFVSEGGRIRISDDEESFGFDADGVRSSCKPISLEI